MIHQPHFLPWLPYIARMAAVDKMVFLDDVIFRKNYYQNRTKIRGMNQQSSWVQVPIRKNGRRAINRTELAPNTDKHIEKLQVRFDKEFNSFSEFHTHREKLFEFLNDVKLRKLEYLSDVNIESMLLIFRMLDREPPSIYMSSDMAAGKTDSTSRIIQICEKLDCSTLFTGYGASHNNDVHNHSALKKNNVKLVSFPKKTSTWEFQEGISIMQWIFEKGSDAVNLRLNEFEQEPMIAKAKSVSNSQKP